VLLAIIVTGRVGEAVLYQHSSLQFLLQNILNQFFENNILHIYTLTNHSRIGSVLAAAVVIG